MTRPKRGYPYRRSSIEITPEMDAAVAEIVMQTKKRGTWSVNNFTEAVRYALDLTAATLSKPGRVEVRSE